MPRSQSRRRAEKIPVSALMAVTQSSEEAELSYLNFRVPEPFHREFKIYAAQHGMSMVKLLQQSFKQFRKHNSG